jgi:tetratricopeptide (TPR) repeat protein
MSELDVFGVLRGTDKSSAHFWAWDYLRNYEDLFARWRHSEINLIEIGVMGGGSLNTWHDYFDKAKLIGIDIDPRCVRHERDRIVIKIGSQDDQGFLKSVAADYAPTIVIDDGSHLAHHMIASFEALFPLLLPGGLYVLEDMAFHFEESTRQWEGHKVRQGSSPIPIYDYLSPFIRARAAALDEPKDAQGFERYAFEHIDSITVSGGLVAVRKKSPRSFDLDVALFERKLQQGDHVTNMERYAHYLCKHRIHWDRAESLLRHVLKVAPNNQSALADLFVVLMHDERLEEAAEIAEQLTRLDPKSRRAWNTLADVQRIRRRPDLEMKARDKLAEIS